MSTVCGLTVLREHAEQITHTAWHGRVKGEGKEEREGDMRGRKERGELVCVTGVCDALRDAPRDGPILVSILVSEVV